MRNKNVLNYKERLEQLDHIDQSDDMFQMQPKVKKNCCQNCCKKFVKFMISRVGLLIVMVAYLAAGGIIFEQLESQNENKALKLNEKVLEDLLRRIYKQIEINSTRVKDASFHGFLDNEINKYREFITNSTLNGTLTENSEPQWDFFGSVFYCVTLVTTIGYGHISCKTKYGKAFTIIYSSFGVPIFMGFLTNSGSSLAALFKFIYLRYNSFKRRSIKRKITRMRKSFSKIDAELDKSSEVMMMNNQPDLNIENSSQQSSKKSSKISLKSFRFKNNEDKRILRLDSIADEKTPKKLEKKKDSKNNSIKESNETKSESQKKQSLNSQTNQDQLKTITKQKSIDNNQEIFDVMKRIDGLIDGENSVCDNTSYCSEINLQRLDIFGNNLKSVAEVDIKEEESLSASDNEVDDQEKELNKFLIPNLFARKQTKVKTRISDKRKKFKKKLSRTEKSIDSISLHKSNNEASILEAPILMDLKLNISTNSLDKTFPAATEVKNESEILKPKKDKFRFFSKSFSIMPKKKIERKNTTLPELSNDSNERKKSGPEIDEVSDTCKIDDQPVACDEKSQGIKLYNGRSLSNPYKTSKSQSTRTGKHSTVYNTKQLQLIYQQYQEEREKKNGVPIFLVVSIIIIYLVFGMLFFSKVEEWRKLDALYFCFTTLTTIGFGDFIPGSSLLNKNENKKNMYISAIYIFGGLTLITMNFYLISRQVSLKIKQFNRKIGLNN